MFETSKDILFIVIAFCILWLTAFFCWGLYYIAMILKGIKGKSDKVDEIMGSIKAKIEKPSAFFPIAIEGAKEAISFIRDLKEKKGRKEEKEEEECTCNKRKK